MIENKKYYNTISWGFFFIVVVVSSTLLFMISFDYGNDSILQYSLFDWILTVFIGIINLFVLYITIVIKMKISYIFVNENKLHVKTVFGTMNSVSLSANYKCIERKGKLHHIIIMDANNKPALLMTTNWGLTVDDFKELLEAHRENESTQN